MSHNPGFIVFECGGTGTATSPLLAEWAWRNAQIRVIQILLDTDSTSEGKLARIGPDDRFVSLQLERPVLRAFIANAALYGPAMAALVTDYPNLFDPDSAQNGSRTVRVLTDVAFQIHREKLIDEIANAISALHKTGGADHIIPILVGSTGGGCGSALLLLLASLLASPQERLESLLPYPDFPLMKAVVFAADPTAQARTVNPRQSLLIRANAMAFRIECTWIPQALGYVFHIGRANDGGVVLDHPDEIAQALAQSVSGFMTHYELIKSDLVNNVDSFVNYPLRAEDTPERVYGVNHVPNGAVAKA